LFNDKSFPPFFYAVFLRVFTCVCSSDMTWCDCSMWRVICVNIVPCVIFQRMQHSLRFTPMYIFSIICDVLSLSIRCGPASVLYVYADALYDTAHHSKWSDTLYTLVCRLAIIWDTDASLCWYLSTSSAPLHAYLHSKHISMHSLRFSIVLYYFQACAHSENTYFRGIHSIHVYKGPYRFSVSVTVFASIDVSLSNPAILSDPHAAPPAPDFPAKSRFLFFDRCDAFSTFSHQRNISTTSTRVILGS
jgi:hypothetical protein